MAITKKTANTDSDVPDRAQHLLKLLIENYIRDGQPVGSTTLARNGQLELSPATIRNVMADLEELGLIESPHTSAGRIPTVKGFRFFVDSLLTVDHLNESEIVQLKGELESGHESKELVAKTSDLLSAITSMAGVVTIPRPEAVLMRHVEFLPLSDNSVLTILVMNEEEVQNRIIHTARKYSPAELTQAANYLNEAFAGKNMNEVQQMLVQEMQETRDRMNSMMIVAIEMANQVFAQDTADYVLAGQTNLMDFADMGDVDKLKQLFEAFNAKRDILHLLDQSMHAEGVQIFLGEESGYNALGGCSLVTSPYEVNGQIAGVLGVIGPTRMHYDRVVPVVDITARLLGAALNRRS